MAYAERPAAVPGVVLWRQTPAVAGDAEARILPDGCMDLIWDGAGLLIAGPDTRARWHRGRAGATYVGLRFARGLGPAILGVAAHEVTDRSPALDEVWSSAAARSLTERVGTDPVAGLDRWLAASAPGFADPLGPAVFRWAGQGVPVATIAERLGLSARQLQRRCLPLFGYGPRHLGRILRLGRALDAARGGRSLADAAATAGYADQAHLSREVRDLVATTPSQLLDGSGWLRLRTASVG